MSDRISACLVAVIGLGLYLYTSFPYPDWLDAPELAAAAFRLGVFYPPGSPLTVMAGHLAWFWPSGMPPIFSAFFAAAALYVLARLVQDIWRSLGPRGRALEHAGVFLATAIFAVTPGFWSQAIRCEVYTPACFVFLCALRELAGLTLDGDPARDHQRADKMMAFTGMGLAIHPLVALSALAGTLVLLATRDGRRNWLAPRRAARLGLMILLGAAPLFLIPLMVQSPLDYRWGDPTSFLGWLAFVLGTTFSPTFSASLGTVSEGSLRVLAVVTDGLGMPVLVVSLAGLYLLARTRLRLALILGLVVVASTLTLVLQRSIRLDNPDVTGYALPAMAALFLAAVAGLALVGRLLQKLGPRMAWLVAGLTAAGLFGYGIAAGGSWNRSGCTGGRALAVRSLQLQPERTLMILGDFNLVFMFDYLIQVERIRPDLDIFYLRDLDNPPLRAALARSDPELEALLPTSRAIDGLAQSGLLNNRPLALDLGPHPSPAGPGHLLPRGLTWLVRQGETPDETDIAAQLAFFRDFASPACAGTTARDARTSDLISWHAYWHALGAHALGLQELGDALLTVAACMSPGDRTVAAARARFGNPPAPVCPPGRTATLPPPATPHPAPGRALLLLIGLLAWALPLSAQRLSGLIEGVRLAIVLTGLILISVALGL